MRVIRFSFLSSNFRQIDRILTQTDPCPTFRNRIFSISQNEICLNPSVSKEIVNMTTICLPETDFLYFHTILEKRNQVSDKKLHIFNVIFDPLSTLKTHSTHEESFNDLVISS